jgi:hypothetical protein
MLTRVLAIGAATVALSLLRPTFAVADERYAIVIGSDRAGQQVAEEYKELSYADDDALRMHLLLSAAGYKSHLFTKITGLDTVSRFKHFRAPGANGSVVSSGTDAPTYSTIVDALKTVIRTIKAQPRPAGPAKRDQLFIYFSGHGDSNAMFLDDQPLTYDELTGILAQANNVRGLDIHILIDACMISRPSDEGRSLLAHVLFQVPNAHVMLGVTPQREALEWKRAKAGVMTYVWSSALVGAASLGGSELTYDHLMAYADTAFLRVSNLEAKMVPLAARESRRLTVIEWRGRGFRELIVPAGRDFRLRVFLGGGPTVFVETHLGKQRKQDTILRLPLTTGEAYEIETIETLDGGAMKSRVAFPADAEGATRLEALSPIAANDAKGAIDDSLDRGLFAAAYDDAEYQRYLTWQQREDLTLPLASSASALVPKSSAPDRIVVESRAQRTTAVTWAACGAATALAVGGVVAQLEADSAFQTWSTAGNEADYQAGQTRTHHWELARSISFGSAAVSAAACVVSWWHDRRAR